MAPLAAQHHEAERWAGQGRLVVRHTFLDLVEAQPSVQRRSHTDSALWRQALLEQLPDYRTGRAAPVLREHGEGSDSDDAAAQDPGAIGTSSDWSTQPSERGGGNETDRSREEQQKAIGRGDKRTTLMLRNLPNNYSRQMLLDMFDAAGFAGGYDFVYLPMDFSRGCGLGYAFVNLVSADLVLKFRAAFDGFRDWAIPTTKICQVSWSDPQQGLKANVKRYRNSPVMHPSVPDEYKPCIFEQGRRVPFPAPGCRIARPQTRARA